MLDARSASLRVLRPAPSRLQVEASVVAYEIRAVIRATLAERAASGKPTRTGRAFRQEWQRYTRRNVLANRAYRARTLRQERDAAAV